MMKQFCAALQLAIDRTHLISFFYFYFFFFFLKKKLSSQHILEIHIYR